MSSTVELLPHFEALAGYREVWNRLLDQTPQGHFFQSWDWLATYWKHFQADQQLRLFLHKNDHQVVGIVPLVLRSEKTRLGRVRVLTYPLDAWGSYYGPIGPEPGKTLQVVLEHLRHTRQDWDLLELRWISPEDRASGWTWQAMKAAGYKPICTLWNHTAVVELADGQAGWQRYCSQRSAKWRTSLRTAEKKSAALGPVEHVRYRPLGETAGQTDPRWDLYEACYQVAERSWQSRSQTGTTLCHPSVRDFLREVHAAAARLGAVDMNLLYVGGRPVAFLYNYVWQGRVYGLRRGFDPEVAPPGAGNLLLARALEDSFLRNDVLYDLGLGYLKTKQGWMPRLMPIYRCSCFLSCTPRMLLIRWKRLWEAWHLPSPLSPSPSLPQNCPTY